MTDTLGVDDFAAFFEELHGYEPFPWQRQLAQQVCMSGWPFALDLPTGTGKTAAIDIAVFHLALEADRGPERCAPVRVLFVVDRRLVVDSAYDRARDIANKLDSAQDGILKCVADRLRCLAEEGKPPLAVARLRGGVPKEPDWVRTPAQPTVVVSTVDQVGSRVLFRGYGVSDTMRPVHAGLLGADALLLLDEAHLSQPFEQTIRASRMFQQQPSWSENAAPSPFRAVTLSATLSTQHTDTEAPFRLSDEDRTNKTLGKRLNAAKPAELIEVKAKSTDDAFEEAFAERAWALSRTGGGTATVVAVVVNRVRRARHVFEALIEKGARPLPEKASADTSAGEELQQEAIADIALLIGRVRELDRAETLHGLLPRMMAKRETKPSDRPLFVVATQSIEAGADLDFDALVTEIAPLDCMRQRFGRLNRMGREDIEARAAVIAASDQISKNASDPLYGDAARETWHLLVEKGITEGKGKTARRVIEFGITAALAWVPTGEALKPYLAPCQEAPVLLPRDIEFWSRTSPIPAVDPEISLYLHGPGAGPPDVGIVWRTDLGEEDREAVWFDRVRVCPPSSLEAISVPIDEARKWLRKGTARLGDIPDVEAGAAENDVRDRAPTKRQAFRWRGEESDETKLIEKVDDLRPGDLVVVPSTYGGCDRWGWAPGSEAPVRDRGREANREHRGRDIVRLTRASPELGFRAENERERIDELKELSNTEILAEFEPDIDRPSTFRITSRPSLTRSNDGRPLAIEVRVTKQTDRNEGGGEAVTEDDDSFRAIGHAVTLAAHSGGVEGFARRFAEQAGLPGVLVEDVALAGFLHDAGKAHPDFKCFLYGGDELASIAGPDLAKSARLPSSRGAWAQSLRRSGLCQGARHEVASLGFAEAHPRLKDAHDPELVLWLVGTHHGHGRPFFPAVEWPREGERFETDLGDGVVTALPARPLAALTASWIDLFSRLQRRYGPWGLARLEATLRLADHRQSEAERKGLVIETKRAELETVR
ncbi:MAG: type I-U CRISPR-associated helicase/endonuclease Cas3 [Alphaproteobacteria bacterium]